MSNMVRDKDDLAEILVAMSFGELMDVASQLVEMNEDKDVDRDVKTALGMAQTLYDWAQGHIE